MARCRALARRALDAGARLFEMSPASVDTGLVRTPEGAVRVNRVIVAVDGGLEDVVPELATRVRTARLQMLATAPTDEVHLRRPVYRRWGYDYWQQLANGRVALGGCRDLFADDEWNAPADPSEPVQRALDRVLRETIGVRRAEVTHRWAGRVGFTADQLPVIEEVRPGVVACGAYSGTGNLVGALAARAAVELACTGRSEVARTLGARL
jgi:glycine/D-amino acid oxidase-like deaminating enzyme